MRKFTATPKYISASSNNGAIVLNKDTLTRQFTDVFNKAMGGDTSAEAYFLRIDIKEEFDGVLVDIEAETYFDENENLLDYEEYRSIMDEVGKPAMSRSEYYQSMNDRETLEEKMDKVIKAYNPDWYFELYNACRIQAYLDNAVLEA